MTIRKGTVIDFRTILLLDLLYMLFFLLSGKPEVVVAAFLLSGTVLFLTELYVAMIRYAVLFVALFFYYHAITNLRLPFLQGTLFSLLGVAAFIIQRILPFLMLAVVIRDRKNISEITASLERCRLPKGIILSMTVMLRYFPSMKEELRIIIEAMKLKGIDTSWRGVLRPHIQRAGRPDTGTARQKPEQGHFRRLASCGTGMAGQRARAFHAGHPGHYRAELQAQGI